MPLSTVLLEMGSAPLAGRADEEPPEDEAPEDDPPDTGVTLGSNAVAVATLIAGNPVVVPKPPAAVPVLGNAVAMKLS